MYASTHTYLDKYMQLEKTDLNRGQTDHISLTHDPDLQPPASYGHDLLTCKVQGQQGQLVRKIEWKQTDGQMDGWR